MSMLICVILVEIMITTVCAPNLDKLKDVLRNAQITRINSTNFNDEVKYIDNMNSSHENIEENIAMQNVIPHKEDILEFGNQEKTEDTNKTFKYNTELNNTQTDNKMVKANTEAHISGILSKENYISDSDSSSDWLDPEFDPPASTKGSQTKQAIPKKKECNKCAIVDLLSSESNNKPETKSILNANSEKEPHQNATVRTSTTKREMPHPFLIKLLRNIDNSKELNPVHKVNIDGYDYNINICRYRGDRYLCGYNKNLGDVKDFVQIEDVGGGCIIRGDRMECGYKIGSRQVEGKSDMSSVTRTSVPNRIQLNNIGASTGRNPDILVSSTPLPNRRLKPKIQRACYEQDDRVICYDIPG